MSLGFIGYCRKSIEYPDAVIYEYSGSNWNLQTNDSKAEMAYDGVIYIDKNVLGYPKSSETGYINWLSTAIDDNCVYLMYECKNAFIRQSIPFDYIAYRCLHKIFKKLYCEGVFPEKECFIQ